MYPPGPGRGATTHPAGWLAAAVVVVAAAVVTIALVLTGGAGSPDAAGSGGPLPPGSPSTGPTSATPSSTITAPTTDALPSNAGNGSCSATVSPNLVAVSFVTELGLVQDGTPDTAQAQVFADCASAPVRSRLSRLYGVRFGIDYSGDLTGGNNRGPTARYTVGNEAGSAVLTLTLTRQADRHYEVTDFGYGR